MIVETGQLSFGSPQRRDRSAQPPGGAPVRSVAPILPSVLQRRLHQALPCCKAMVESSDTMLFARLPVASSSVRDTVQDADSRI